MGGSNPRPADHQSDAHPTEPPRPAAAEVVGAAVYTPLDCIIQWTLVTMITLVPKGVTII